MSMGVCRCSGMQCVCGNRYHNPQVQQPWINPFQPQGTQAPQSDNSFLQFYNSKMKLDLNSVPLETLEAHIKERKAAAVKVKIEKLKEELARLEKDLKYTEGSSEG